MAGKKSDSNPALLRLYADEQAFKTLEQEVIAELSQENALLNDLFKKSLDSISAVGPKGSIGLLRKYLKDPLLFGLYTSVASEGMDIFTITPIPTIDENNWNFNGAMPETGIYQDPAGIGIVNKLALAKPGLRYNPIMVFECSYLPMFMAEGAPKKIVYVCTNVQSESTWEVSWERKATDGSVTKRGAGVLYHNPGYIFANEARNMYEKNIGRLQTLNHNNSNNELK